ncbi:trypsin Inhibitor like cysteine rich domain protein [Cooperia oncophora]
MLSLFLVGLIGEAASVSCPPCTSGLQCDTNTGICRPFRQAFSNPPQLSCGTCSLGTMCDSNTGICRAFRFPGNYDQPTTSLCVGVTCPTGYMCDNNTGTCRKFRDLSAIPNAPIWRMSSGICRSFRPTPSAIDRCQGVLCPQGTECDLNTGVCRPFRQADNLPPVTCPANSYYTGCASPCPNTCTENSSRCSLPCIPTCACNQGYVQASATDTSCILSTQCQQYRVDRCTKLQCPPDTNCLDGYCNPKMCPSVVKPAIRAGCRYMLTRNINGCLAIDLNC